MVEVTPHPYIMRNLDEVRGQLYRIEEADGNLLVLVGEISVILPMELASKLKELQGKKIGILRLDGYRLRAL
jgi:hypothetical protein